MAITETINSPLNVSRMVTISHIDTGTVAARAFDIGFKPRYVLVINETSRDGYEFVEGMADAEALKTVAAGTRTFITSNGITPSTLGFTLGLDTDVYVTSEQLSIVCFG